MPMCRIRFLILTTFSLQRGHLVTFMPLFAGADIIKPWHKTHKFCVELMDVGNSSRYINRSDDMYIAVIGTSSCLITLTWRSCVHLTVQMMNWIPASSHQIQQMVMPHQTPPNLCVLNPTSLEIWACFVWNIKNNMAPQILLWTLWLLTYWIWWSVYIRISNNRFQRSYTRLDSTLPPNPTVSSLLTQTSSSFDACEATLGTATKRFRFYADNLPLAEIL